MFRSRPKPPPVTPVSPSHESGAGDPSHATDAETTVQAERRYEVVSVEHATAPDGGTGKNWHRYVIEVPGSTITGVRRGSRQEVTRFANEYVEKLSTRNSPKSRAAQPVARRR